MARQARHAFCQPVLRHRIGETHVSLRRVVAEIQAGRDGHAGLFEQLAGEGLAVARQRRTIRIKIEGPAWLGVDAQAQAAQCRQKIVAPRRELPAPRLEQRDGFRPEGGEGGGELVCTGTPDSKRPITWLVSRPGFSTLSATLRRTGSSCSAIQTVPNPPSPMRWSSL